ncbi:tRNA (adenosine(37)-N6)-threonylcarbamoyltransferase complex transferase subunit TsaD [bacterium]|nr:tRNA (adenosine(37)-N6)-threonylcarbamoyltransferase complex transferase subunit TsaD [bacterium]
MKVLGIETSCDETAVAIVNDEREILAQQLWSQQEHEAYGGVVPELASRAHLDRLDGMIADSLAEANLTWNEIDAIAVTSGPGLIGGLIVGVMTAKTLAACLNKPLIGVNHLEGHALTVGLSDGLEPPYLLLLVSGGHCQWLEVTGIGRYRLLGQTLDDAVGEAFDKCAKMLGLPYPGGPSVEKAAQTGNPKRFKLPMPLEGRKGCDMSFSGLKTAVRNLALELNQGKPLSDKDCTDLCASFQYTVGESLAQRFRYAAEQTDGISKLVIAGGVAANQYLRMRLLQECDALGWQLAAPPLKLCTDNAAMIAWAGLQNYKAGRHDDLMLTPRARWPLSDLMQA